MTTVSEKYFGQAFLDDIVSWISDNMDPNEVFSQQRLITWIRDYLEPEDVFTYESLGTWALSNGYKEE